MLEGHFSESFKASALSSGWIKIEYTVSDAECWGLALKLDVRIAQDDTQMIWVPNDTLFLSVELRAWNQTRSLGAGDVLRQH